MHLKQILLSGGIAAVLILTAGLTPTLAIPGGGGSSGGGSSGGRL
jgi:hypothetical protein